MNGRNQQSQTSRNQPIDLAQDQRRFDEWLEAARSGDDVRNRIAAMPGITQGAFGVFHLLMPEERNGRPITGADAIPRCAIAANDAIYQQERFGNS